MEKIYYGQTFPQLRHYNSLKNFVGQNSTYPCGDILCVSTRNNDEYDLFLLADGISNFRELYTKEMVANGYRIVDFQEVGDTLRIKIEK